MDQVGAITQPFSLPHDEGLRLATVAASEILAWFLAVHTFVSSETTIMCSVMPCAVLRTRIGNPIGKFEGNGGVCWGRMGYHLGNSFPTIHAVLLIFSWGSNIATGLV